MKIAIVGSRNIKDAGHVYNIISEAIPKNCSEIVSGGAKGIDTLAEKYAKDNNIPIKIFLPDYESYGITAPLIRNGDIVRYADEVYAFWDMKSRGTAATVKKCIDEGKPFKIIRI